MLNIRQITRREWNETPRDYRGITTILVCRHCGDWAFPWRPDMIPAECSSPTGHEWTEREQKTMLGCDERGTFLEFVEVFEMTEDEFAEFLGFDSYEELARASETIVLAGDVGWFITQLPDGRWAAWDDAELELDRVEYFATREEAEAFHRNAFVYTLVLDDFVTERGGRKAVRLPWGVVEALLGSYDDTEEGGEKLISLLRDMPAASGWPQWLDDPATTVVTDDAGCWFVGPRAEE